MASTLNFRFSPIPNRYFKMVTFLSFLELHLRKKLIKMVCFDIEKKGIHFHHTAGKF